MLPPELLHLTHFGPGLPARYLCLLRANIFLCFKSAVPLSTKYSVNTASPALAREPPRISLCGGTDISQGFELLSRRWVKRFALGLVSAARFY